MKKVLLIAAAMFLALAATVGLAPTASAYPELTCNLTVEPQVLNEGETFTATATAAEVESSARAAAEGDDIAWEMTFNGETRTGTGAVFVQKFKAPNVDDTTKLTLTAKSTSTAGTCPHQVTITVLPDGTTVSPPDDGGLPNTGGPRLLILLAGLGLLAAGVVAVRKSRSNNA
jgi:hypothetical protein